MLEGHPIDAESLDNTEFRGVSLGLPAWIERLSWKTFQKAFHRDPETGRLRGWNVRVEQRGIAAPSVPRLRRGVPMTFGHFLVVPHDPARPYRGTDRGLMIHYGHGGNAPWDTLRFLRDPIVALNAGSSDLLLGWSYLEIGLLRIPTPSYFVLERERPVAHVAQPHRRLR